MSTIRLRLPDLLHKPARQLAEQANVSINQLITLALAAEKYLEARAQRGRRAKFLKAMSQVAKTPPADYDRLPR